MSKWRVVLRMKDQLSWISNLDIIYGRTAFRRAKLPVPIHKD
jgi:hypothetical protein